MKRNDAPPGARSLKAVLFDFDGTLADSIPHIRASFRHAVREVLGEDLPDEVLLQHVGMPLEQQMRILANDEAIAAQLVEAYRAFNHATHDEMVRAFPGAHEALAAIREHGAAIGLVTSKSRTIAERGLALLGMDGDFDVVVTADDVEAHKPDPAPVLRALDALGVEAEAAAYVGDSPADMLSARAAGSLAVAATWGVASRERLAEAQPDVFVDALAEVPAALGFERTELAAGLQAADVQRRAPGREA